MPYLFERKQFGSFIGDFQAMQVQYAQAAVDIESTRLLVYNAARRKMAGLPFVKEAAMAKLQASQVAERVASRAIEWMGGAGFVKDAPLEKFYRDAKVRGDRACGGANAMTGWRLRTERGHDVTTFPARRYRVRAFLHAGCAIFPRLVHCLKHWSCANLVHVSPTPGYAFRALPPHS